MNLSNNCTHRPRLLIECTYVYDHPYVNSGIQRVVRNIIQHTQQQHTDITCIPVLFKNGKIYQVFEIEPRWRDRTLIALRKRSEALRKKYWFGYEKLQTQAPFTTKKNLARCLYVFAHAVGLPLTVVQAIFVLISRYFVDSKRACEITSSKDDILLLLDSSWHSEIFVAIDHFKKTGAQVISVIYDLIPLTHPQFCDSGLVKVFEAWFARIVQSVDGFIAISQTISDELQTRVAASLSNNGKPSPWFDYFYLGSDLDKVQSSKPIRDTITQLLQRHRSMYLMVSTIEPRKNHDYLLDAFEALWKQGLSVQLCFVGRVGWKCATLMRRVHAHPELGRRLFHLHDLSDAELEFCYQQAKALVFPSFVEGFGLPVVEAMQRGLPVMASDIPVFREVGSDFVAYFDLAQPASLADLIRSFEQTGKFPALRDVQEWHWLNWRDAAQMLVEKVLAHTPDQNRTAAAQRDDTAPTHQE